MSTTTKPQFDLAELQASGFTDSGIRLAALPSFSAVDNTAKALNCLTSQLRIFRIIGGEWAVMLPPNHSEYKTPTALLP